MNLTFAMEFVREVIILKAISNRRSAVGKDVAQRLISWFPATTPTCFLPSPDANYAP